MDKKQETRDKKKDEKIENKTSKSALSYNEKREFGALEAEIERLQNRKSKIETQFLNVEIPEEDIAKKSEELQDIITTLDEKEERWLELSMKMEG